MTFFLQVFVRQYKLKWEVHVNISTSNDATLAGKYIFSLWWWVSSTFLLCENRMASWAKLIELGGLSHMAVAHFNTQTSLGSSCRNLLRAIGSKPIMPLLSSSLYGTPFVRLPSGELSELFPRGTSLQKSPPHRSFQGKVRKMITVVMVTWGRKCKTPASKISTSSSLIHVNQQGTPLFHLKFLRHIITIIPWNQLWSSQVNIGIIERAMCYLYLKKQFKRRELKCRFLKYIQSMANLCSLYLFQSLFPECFILWLSTPSFTSLPLSTLLLCPLLRTGMSLKMRMMSRAPAEGGQVILSSSSAPAVRVSDRSD